MSNTYFNLASGPLTQDWSNAGLITVTDNWSGVPSIQGFLGQDITTGTGTDPQTLTGDSAVASDLDVIANQNNTTLATGGVAEFDGIANPTIALQGIGHRRRTASGDVSRRDRPAERPRPVQRARPRRKRRQCSPAAQRAVPDRRDRRMDERAERLFRGRDAGLGRKPHHRGRCHAAGRRQ